MDRNSIKLEIIYKVIEARGKENLIRVLKDSMMFVQANY